ncbi:MAG: hypothetical protein IT178_08710, partial [Acidobacteria bacterium]|nr:hypothetical protein [Acidobacteriota bacterium]
MKVTVTAREHVTAGARRLLLACGALFLFWLPAPAAAQTVCINQNAPAPLEICVQQNGTPGVWASNNG